ncbi:MAG: hypothetical protein QM710_06635 [Flavobacterium sp.]
MAQNKLEKQIKEKLDSREIQPSAQAWDRLDAMLTVAEEKKTKRSFGWLYIAAGILVFVSAGMFFFSQNSIGTNDQNGVAGMEIKKDSVQNAVKTGLSTAGGPQENQVATADQNQQNAANNNQRVSVNQNQSKSIKINPSNSQGPAVKNNPLINRGKQIEYQNSSDVALKDLPKIEERKAVVVYDAPKKSASSKSDEELLAGLDNAAKQSSNRQTAVKVDARSLLSQVDGELEMTFREKVINKVSKNYKEVKVALANRNHE